jgi:hypothetical protein
MEKQQRRKYVRQFFSLFDVLIMIGRSLFAVIHLHLVNVEAHPVSSCGRSFGNSSALSISSIQQHWQFGAGESLPQWLPFLDVV